MGRPERALKFSVPIRVQGPNLREHHFARKRRVSQERAAVCGSSLVQLGPDCWRKLRLPCIVTLTRVGKRLLDDDNLAGSMKAVRDQVAQLLGCGDGPNDPITWKYDQRKGKDFAVEVEIASAAAEGAA